MEDTQNRPEYYQRLRDHEKLEWEWADAAIRLGRLIKRRLQNRADSRKREAAKEGNGDGNG